MSAANKIPATVITGFLGAGKTSLIRHVLATANGRRIALIVNEFGDLGIDGEILAGCGEGCCSEDDIIELANGCICCTVADASSPPSRRCWRAPRRPTTSSSRPRGWPCPSPWFWRSTGRKSAPVSPSTG